MRWIVACVLLMLAACAQPAPTCPPCPSVTCLAPAPQTPPPREITRDQRKRIDDDLAKAQQKIEELKR